MNLFICYNRIKKLLPVACLLTLVSCSADSLDGNNTLTLPEFLTELGNLTWSAPTQREDTTPISTSEIDTYKVYYGTTSGFYKNQIDISKIVGQTAQLEEFNAGTYYFAITTVDTDGRESKYSQEYTVTF